jgi:hypothetical protein
MRSPPCAVTQRPGWTVVFRGTLAGRRSCRLAPRAHGGPIRPDRFGDAIRNVGASISRRHGRPPHDWDRWQIPRHRATRSADWIRWREIRGLRRESMSVGLPGAGAGMVLSSTGVYIRAHGVLLMSHIEVKYARCGLHAAPPAPREHFEHRCAHCAWRACRIVASSRIVSD